MQQNHQEFQSISLQHAPVNKLSTNWLTKLIAILIVAVLIGKIVVFPSHPWGLMAALLLYGVVIWKFPPVWLLLLPAVLPVSDLAIETGRFFFIEFDFFLLLTFAVNLWHRHFSNPLRLLPPVLSVLFCLFFFFYLISFFAGLLPIQALDANSFTNYYSHYNSLRVAKGVFWSFLLFPSLSYYYQCVAKSKVFFAYAMIVGLAAVVITSIWERVIFTGLLNFTDDYRITSLFSSMHTGGGHIDIYLVLAIPFVAILFYQGRMQLIQTMFGIALFLSSIYVLVVTFSRGPYLSFCIQFVVFLISLLMVFRKQLISNWKKFSLIIFFVLIIGTFLPFVFKGGYIQSRFDQINASIQTRMSHWHDAIRMMNNDIFTDLFGMGLGAYPRTYYFENSENIIPATYLLKTDKNIPFLRLWGGDSMYMEQKINLSPHTKYLLSIDFRGNLDNPRMTIPICEKGLLYSFNCQWISIETKAKKNEWVHIEKIINTNSTGESKGKLLGKYSRRPIKFSLFNDYSHAVIDIKQISLRNTDFKELLHNGDFSKGLDYWFFTTDNHLPWHCKNLFIQILFDQGWAGVLTFFSILLYAFSNQIKLLFGKDRYAPIFLTSLTGLLIVGTVASPFDVPRITLLIFLIIFLSCFKSNNVTTRS